MSAVTKEDFFFLVPLQRLLDTSIAFIEPCVLEAWNSLVIQNLTGLLDGI